MEETKPLFDVGQPLPKPPPEAAPEPEPKPPVDLTVPMQFEALAGAEISADGVYRYALWRKLLPKGGTVLFVGLNPSKADGETDDPTIRAMMAFARRWHCATLLVGNIFAFRSTDPRALRKRFDGEGCIDRGGPLNGQRLVEMRKGADLCIACWGNWGSTSRMGRAVYELLAKVGPVHCLRVNKSGHPSHPLYLPRKLDPVPFSYAKGAL